MFNVVLDLDNTLICSLTHDEYILNKHQKHLSVLESVDMDGMYQVYLRPHLKEFLIYLFKNFDVTIWTAASMSYGIFIIKEILLKQLESEEELKRKNFKLFLYDKNCERSQKKFNKNSPKDLRYLYKLPEYNKCNTLIIDDLIHVYEANNKQTIRADYFDASKKNSVDDDFLLRCIDKLEEIKENYKTDKCITIE